MTRIEQRSPSGRETLRPLRPVLLAAFLFASLNAAVAAERWQEAASGAVAILPEPQQPGGISGGSLFCAEQRWSFLFRLEAGAVPAGWTSAATLTVGNASFAGDAAERGGAVLFPVPAEAIETLRAGNLMSFASADAALAADFTLRGSSAVLQAAAPRCSQVDMSDYSRVELTAGAPAVDVLAPLLAEEAKRFRNWAGRSPSHAAAVVAVDDERELLFGSLCGSTSYYGVSGCTLHGFARGGASEDWRPVFELEGLQLFIDPDAATAGWPDLVTLPVVGGIERTHWQWDGSFYAVKQAAEPEDAQEQALQGSPVEQASP